MASEKLLTDLFLGSASKAGFQPPVPDYKDGSWQMPYGKLIKGLVLVSCVFFSVLGVKLTVMPIPREQGRPWLVMVGIMFELLAFSGVVEAFVKRISFSDDEVRSTGIIGARTAIPWAQISDVRYSFLCLWLVFVSTKGEKVGIHPYRKGFRDFCQVAVRRLEPATATRLQTILRRHLRSVYLSLAVEPPKPSPRGT
jgi:hypothetical protein